MKLHLAILELLQADRHGKADMHTFAHFHCKHAEAHTAE
jgi:hypothetical protein